MRLGSWPERVYRALLRAYPRAFRERFDAELIEVFRAQSVEPEYEGAVGRLRLWRDILWDWMRTLIVTRRGAPRRRAGQRGGGPAAGGPGGGNDWMGGGVVEAIRQDLRFALRSLRRAPGFTAVTVTTLAIGIGSTAAIFGVVKSVLLEPLPYGEPDRVVTVWSAWNDTYKVWVSEAEYRSYRTQTGIFADLALWNEVNVTLTDPRNPERVLAVGATPNLVETLGVRMEAGRFFTTDEAIRADTLSADVIVISHEAWRRRWAGDPGVVGTSVGINGRLREIVGILPAGFRLPTQFGTVEAADVYFPRYVPPTPVTDYPDRGGSHGFFVVGRLRPDATAEGARRGVENVIARIHAESGSYAPEYGFRPLVFSVQDDIFGTVRPALVALFATVGFLLLIACANVASMMLARGDDRVEELAVRAALGAGRRRLIGQLALESLVLAVMGGAIGLTVASVGVHVFESLAPRGLPRAADVSLDGTVVAFTVAVALATSLLFGVWPATRSIRAGLASVGGRRSTAGKARTRWQGALVSTQTALALVLGVGAVLMARTFEGLASIDPGFAADDVLTVAISLPTTRYPNAEASTTFWREALRRIGETPGVRSAGAIRSLPLASQVGDWGLDLEGYDEAVNPRASGDWQIAAPGYFETLGIPLVRGRALTWSDDDGSPLAVVVNETLAAHYWPGADPIGKRIRVGDGPWGSVVGVVGDVRHNGLTEEILPKFYVSPPQWNLATGANPTSLRLVVRSVGSPREVVEPIRAVVRALDASLAIAEVRTTKEVLDAAVAQPRVMAVLMGAFGAVALGLALVGVYGVMTYTVGRRTREIGVRMALGAMREEVVGLMLRRGALMIGIGLAIGTVFALALSRYVESLLYGVRPNDPVTFIVVLVVFGAVAGAATYLPSRRAARVDPVRALKSE